MPHVVLNGKVGIEDVFNTLDELFFREGSLILKTKRKFMDSEKNTILVESVSVEGKPPLEFLMMIGSRDDGIVIRIYPGTDIEKTDGVKRILALTALELMHKFNNIAVGKTNLQDFLE